MCAAADRGFTWSDEETVALLKFWGSHDPRNGAPGNKRNFVIYETISEKMISVGFNRSTSQCREKIKRMKREYTLTKQYNLSNSGPKKTMRFFDQFEKVLAEKQIVQERNTSLKAKALAAADLETLPLDSTNHWLRQANIKDNCITFFSAVDTNEKDIPDPWAPDVVLIEGDEAPSTSFHATSNTISPSLFTDEPPSKKQKKANNQMSMFRSIMDAITTKFIHYQEQTDTKFLNQLECLEKERQASEENMQKMWLEFEERRRKDEQQHELHVLSAFKDILGEISVHKNKS